MNRIVVSPKAVALARLLAHLVDERRHTVPALAAGPAVTVDLNVAAACVVTGFTDDTLYRALIELDELGAVAAYTRLADGRREVTTDTAHWLFTALAQNAEVAA